jgi:hypothetical protein
VEDDFVPYLITRLFWELFFSERLSERDNFQLLVRLDRRVPPRGRGAMRSSAQNGELCLVPPAISGREPLNGGGKNSRFVRRAVCRRSIFLKRKRSDVDDAQRAFANPALRPEKSSPPPAHERLKHSHHADRFRRYRRSGDQEGIILWYAEKELTKRVAKGSGKDRGMAVKPRKKPQRIGVTLCILLCILSN